MIDTPTAARDYVPKTSAASVVTHARVMRPSVKVLFITGFAENAAADNGHLEPGMELLTKPFTLEARSTKVAKMLATAAG